MIEAAGAGDRRSVEQLLAAAGLPTADLGAIGLERHGAAGLLRSLVVVPEQRGRGVGGALVDALERDARADGLDALVLLTQTAETFFARRGYVRIDRAAAPAAVRTSAEFTSLCPSSATTMLKSLR